MKRAEHGFSHFIVLLVVALVIGVGVFAAARIAQLNDDSASTQSTELTTEQQAEVDKTPELKEANTALTDVADDLESDLDASALDEDIDALY